MNGRENGIKKKDEVLKIGEEKEAEEKVG